MGKNYIINRFFYVTKWIFNEMGIFMKWIYVKLTIAFFFFFFLLIMKEQIRKMTHFSDFLNEVEFFNDMELFMKWSNKTFIYIHQTCVFASSFFINH